MNDPDARPQRRVASLAALLLALVSVLALHGIVNEPEVPYADARRYLSLAWGLHEHGTFAPVLPGSPPRAPEMVFMPMYPAMLAAALHLDGRLRANVRCVLLDGHGPAAPGCELAFSSVVAFQLVVLALALWLVWHVALDLTGTYGAAWASLVAGIVSGWPLELANLFLLEVHLIALFALLSLAIVRAVRTGRVRWFALVGGTLGLLTLFKAVFAYVALGLAVCWIALALIPRLRTCGAALGRGLIAAPLVFALVIAPWVVRNAVVLDTFGLSSGYGASVLAQRVQYNAMTPVEWGVAFVYWFPDFGDSIARRVFEPESYERLKRVGERSFYVIGNSTGFDESRARARARGEDHVSYLLREEVLGNLPKHLAVTIPMAWQGVFVAGYWGLLGLGCSIVVLPPLLRAGRLDFALLAAAPAVVLVLHALLSVSLPRYNLMLLPLYSVCIGVVAQRVALAVVRRRRRRASP